VERAVLDAAKRPRIMPAVATAPVGSIDTAGVVDSRPWPLLIGSLIALFLSLGANGYLGMLLANMRARYLRDIQAGIG
jgi:hypothetical protein